MTALDRAALLTWLRDPTRGRPAVVSAVYAGLAQRIERGDFDTTERPRKEE